MSQAQRNQPKDPLERPEVRWGLGCLLGSSAVLGLVILTFLIAFALEPPTWAQIVMGVGLVGAGAGLTVIVALALGRSRQQEETLRAAPERPTE